MGILCISFRKSSKRASGCAFWYMQMQLGEGEGGGRCGSEPPMRGTGQKRRRRRAAAETRNRPRHEAYEFGESALRERSKLTREKEKTTIRLIKTYCWSSSWWLLLKKKLFFQGQKSMRWWRGVISVTSNSEWPTPPCWSSLCIVTLKYHCGFTKLCDKMRCSNIPRLSKYLASVIQGLPSI